MKQKSAHLQYDWWKYAAALLIPLILWCSVFSVLKKPKANERLHILFLGSGLNCQTIEQDLTAYLQVNTTQKLKSVQVAAVEYTDENYANQLMAATYSYDLIIISENQMQNTVGQDYFFVLPDALQKSEVSLYEETVNHETMPFGAVVFDGIQHNSFSKYYSNTEKCYIFISPQTENLYPFNTQSSEGDDAAVLAWQWLMEKQ